MTASESFERFYSDHRTRLVGALVGLAGDVETAADAVDEAMARAFARWARLHHHPEPAGWVFVTARNIAKRSAMRRNRVVGRTNMVEMVGPPGGEIWLLVADLPERQREVVVLRHIAGLTERGIGEALGITRGTVSSTLRDAHRALGLAESDDEPAEERA